MKVINMQLIGIYIELNTSKEVMKNLTNGWYPFLEGYEYEDSSKTVKESLYNKEASDSVTNLYTTNKNGPSISVHAIVGMNGSGKSTILEILYRLVNNLAFCTLRSEKRETDAPLLSTKKYMQHYITRIRMIQI